MAGQRRPTRRCTPTNVLVGPVPRQGFRCRGDVLPLLDGKGLDVYVIAPDFSWTMAFTHESYIGPYFTTSAWGSEAPRTDGRVG